MPAVTVPTIAEFERQILETEGPHHVRGLYYADPSDAATWRRWEAERMRREAERRRRYQARAARRIASAGLDSRHYADLLARVA